MQMMRPRINRSKPFLRDLVEENQISAKDLIWPVFIKSGNAIKEAIPTLPGVHRMSLDVLFKEIERLLPLGLRAIALFPAIDENLKNSQASEALNPEGFLPTCIRSLKAKFPELLLVGDVALDPFSSDGHDGIVKDGKILNDESVEILAKMALIQAQAGIDIVAPSDMMDGRVAAIREILEAHQFNEVVILSYTAKYASCFYGPFRDALQSAPKFGDKKTYQMNPANSTEAIRELELDIAEGADMVMVKPAGAYLDIISKLKSLSTVPVAAYQVSGEYAMIEFAAQAGALNRERAILESTLAIKRAGADIILSYYTPELLRLLKA